MSGEFKSYAKVPHTFAYTRSIEKLRFHHFQSFNALSSSRIPWDIASKQMLTYIKLKFLLYSCFACKVSCERFQFCKCLRPGKLHFVSVIFNRFQKRRSNSSVFFIIPAQSTINSQFVNLCNCYNICWTLCYGKLISPPEKILCSVKKNNNQTPKFRNNFKHP